MQQTTIAERRQSRELSGQNKAARFAQITEAASDVYLAATNGGNIAGALEAAVAMQQVREAFDADIMAMVKPLLNTALGIVTDRPPGGKHPAYSDAIIRDCCIEGALKGVQLIGNQINIIAGRCYIAKAGWEYLIKSKVNGLRWWKPEFGVPKTLQNGAIVSCKCTWNINGKEGSLSADVPVKTDSFTGVDGIIGKASRKFYKRVYEAMTGILISDPDDPESKGVSEEDIIENDGATNEKQSHTSTEKSTVQKSASSDSGVQKEMDQDSKTGNQAQPDKDLRNR